MMRFVARRLIKYIHTHTCTHTSYAALSLSHPCVYTNLVLTTATLYYICNNMEKISSSALPIRSEITQANMFGLFFFYYPQTRSFQLKTIWDLFVCILPILFVRMKWKIAHRMNCMYRSGNARLTHRYRSENKGKYTRSFAVVSLFIW